MLWILVGLLVCMIVFLIIKLVRNVTATTEDEGDRLAGVILSFVGIVACGFAVRYLVITLLLTR